MDLLDVPPSGQRFERQRHFLDGVGRNVVGVALRGDFPRADETHDFGRVTHRFGESVVGSDLENADVGVVHNNIGGSAEGDDVIGQTPIVIDSQERRIELVDTVFHEVVIGAENQSVRAKLLDPETFAHSGDSRQNCDVNFNSPLQLLE